MATLDLSTRFEKTQVTWHCPDSERRYVGVFTFDPDSEITLNTSLFFDYTDWEFFRDENRIEIILLTDEKGSLWTLVDCLITSLGMSSIRFSVNYAIEGLHFESKDAIRFRSYQIRLPYLDTWLGRNPFRHAFRDDGSEQWEYARPANIEFDLPSKDLRLILGGAHDSTQQSEPPSVSVVFHSGIVLRRIDGAACSIDWLQEQAFHIIEFLSLLLGRPLWRISVGLEHEDGEFCNLAIRQTVQPGAKHIHSMDVLVPFRAIRENLGSVIENWIKTVELCAPTLELLAGYQTDKSGFLQNRMLMLTTALEVFHRRCLDGTYIPPNEYKAHYETMVQNIPREIGEDHRAALRNKIKYGNEYSMRKRLMQMLARLPAPILDFFPANFVGQAVDWRNQLTHYGDPDETSVFARADEVYLLCRRLEVLLVVSLLHEAGIEHDSLAIGLAQCHRYKGLASARPPKAAIAKQGSLNIDGVFWDYPDLQNEETLKHRLATGSQSDRNWILARMLDFGRVKDTMRLFDMSEIRERLHYLPLREETRNSTYQKWSRLAEVYATSRT